MAKELFRVHPGGGLYKAIDPRICHPLSYFKNYAQLFHNTDEAGARQDLPELQSKNGAHLNRARIGCQPEPLYTAHTPRRLIHPLSIDGRGIIDGVKIIDANGDATRSPELDALRLAHCMPQTNALDAARLIESRGLTAGGATFADLAQAVSQRAGGHSGGQAPDRSENQQRRGS